MIKNLIVLLTILFISLKLGNVIDWSWWLVLAPILATIGLDLLISAVLLIVFRKELKDLLD